jgi:hypothetical protein
MAGFQQLRVNRKVDFTGATKVGMPISSFAGMGIGKVIFVADSTYGSDGNTGLDPNHPKATIQDAIDDCEDWYNDYIFVYRRASSDITTTTPILMGAHTVHLVGMAGNNPQGSLIRLVHTSATDNVLEFPQDEGMHCEVAGFGFAGGATTKGGIAATGAGGGLTGVWIHDCNFGGILTKGTPDYGIFSESGAEFQASVIEDCSFYGSGNNAKGLIAVNGIHLANASGSAANKHLIIRNNIFMGVPGIAINIDKSSGVMILDNKMALDGDTAGAAITLGSGTTGCYVNGNHADFGDTANTTTYYVDSASADANSWGLNYTCGALDYPG